MHVVGEMKLTVLSLSGFTKLDEAMQLAAHQNCSAAGEALIAL